MSLEEELSSLIEKWVVTRRNGGLSLLSKLSEVSYATVRRMYQKESEANLSNIVKVLDIVCEPSVAREFLQKYFTKLARLMEPSLIDRPTEHAVLEINHFSMHDFLIFALAATKNGISESEVRSRKGEEGINSLKKLIEAGAVEKSNDVYVSRYRQFKYVGERRVLNLISSLCDLFDVQRVNSKGSLFRIKHEGLTKEAVLKVYAIAYKASEEIQAVMDDEANHGEYVIGVGMVSTFLKFPNGEDDL